VSGFIADDVDGFTPVTFALELVRLLRRDKRCSHRPSLRMSIALPRFLTARYCRTGRLTPRDYLEAAKVNTVPDDQLLAEELARGLLFPDLEERKATAKAASTAASSTATKQPAKAASVIDATASILSDLASLDLDLDALDALDIDAIDAAIADDVGADDVFELFERLYSSAEPSERALAELVVTFGGPAELAGIAANTVAKVRGFALASLQGNVSGLSPDQVLHGCRAGFTTSLLQECTQPWELAGALAGAAAANPDAGRAPLLEHLDDVLGGDTGGDARTSGVVLSFLRPWTRAPASLEGAWVDGLAEQALSRCADLHDAADLMVAEGRFQPLPSTLVDTSVAEHPVRSVAAGRRLEVRFGVAVCADLFDVWLRGLDHEPTIVELVTVAVDCDAWAAQIGPAWLRHLHDVAAAVAAAGRASTSSPQVLQDVVALADAMQRTGIESGAKLATTMATDAVCEVRDDAQFLPLLDDFLARTIIPHDIERVIAAGQALGIDPAEIYDRLGDALEQLRGMILGDAHDVDRYKRLVDKIVHVPDEIMDACLQAAMSTTNLEAIAALLALDLGAVAPKIGDDLVSTCLGYKGIGGGSNLLKQWFSHRKALRPELRAMIKAQVKDSLLELAFTWINTGEGSAERGLIPQSTTRPFASGDDTDTLDLDATLDAIIGGGKGLDALTVDDLFVQDASRGEAALAVLIDISGSMSGGELAMCAVAVVMLLGRVKPAEIALAVFESDTHVIKPFADTSDLDVVADRVLDLEATGGTRVDAALSWAREQFESKPDADLRLLFVLSDFMFFEQPDELRRHGRTLGDLGVQLLAASHGLCDDKTVKRMLEAQTGQQVKLKNLQALPAVLIEALSQIAQGR
jgi:Mg-chelatase subunit ChlD